MPSVTKRSPRRKARAPLTPLQIATEALRLIDRNGLESFSTRKLAAALRCEAMSLYHHFPSKGQLLDAVAELLISEVELGDSTIGPWRPRLEQILHSYRDMGLRHPEAFPLLVNRRLNSPGALRFLERNVALLVHAGCPPHLAAWIIQFIGEFANGAILNQISSTRQASTGEAMLIDNRDIAERHPSASRLYKDPSTAECNAHFGFAAGLVFDAIQREIALLR